MMKEPRIYNREKTTSSINGVGNLENHMQRMKLDHFLIPNIKICFKWIKDFNVRPKIIKLLEENTVNKILDIHLGNEGVFLFCLLFGFDTQSKDNKSKNKEWGYPKLKSSTQHTK